MTHPFWRASAILAGISAVALLIATPARVAAVSPPRYAAVDLGNFGDAEGINNKSQVVGRWYVDLANGITHAFLWDHGVLHDLGTLGGSYGAARGINDHGAVVGESTAGAWGSLHAFLWANDQMTDLNRDGDVASSASAINDHGDIAGWHRGPDGVDRACVWIGGLLQDLQIPNSILSYANAINDRGAVAGDYRPDASTSCSFLWNDGVFQQIGNCQQVGFGSATGINNRGQIVGILPFLYDKGVVTSISLYLPFAINKSGQIGGGAFLSGHWRAALLDNGVLINADAGADRDSQAFALNDRGELAGFTTEAGLNHAFLWTPSK